MAIAPPRLGIAASSYQTREYSSSILLLSSEKHVLINYGTSVSQIGLVSSKTYHISVIKWPINYDTYQRTIMGIKHKT